MDVIAPPDPIAPPPAVIDPLDAINPVDVAPRSLASEPDPEASEMTIIEAPESSAPRSGSAPMPSSSSSPSWGEPKEEIDMRPEYAVRAAVFYELLSDLGVTPEHPPDDGEKQRKAARVGAKRRLAVISRNDPDLMLDEPGVEAEHLLAEVFALGPLTGILDQLDQQPARDQVREVTIRGPQRVYVDRGRGRERLERGFSCPAAIAMALHRFAGAHLQWDAAAPWLDHRMPDGTRLRGADISVAPDGPVVVIRRPAPAGVGGLSQVGAVSHPVAEYLRAVLCAGGSMLVCIGDGCEGTELLSALAHELARFDVNELGIVRAGSRIVPPRGALVLDAEPGLTAGPIGLAIEAGSARLLIHRAGGAGLASAWAGLSGGVEQLVLGLGVGDPEAALASCVEGLVRGGFGRDRETLRQHVAATINVVVVIGRSARGLESPVMLAEFDAQGGVMPILSRASSNAGPTAGPDAGWTHHREPAFMAELTRRGVTFDASKLAALAQT